MITAQQAAAILNGPGLSEVCFVMHMRGHGRVFVTTNQYRQCAQAILTGQLNIVQDDQLAPGNAEFVGRPLANPLVTSAIHLSPLAHDNKLDSRCALVHEATHAIFHLNNLRSGIHCHLNELAAYLAETVYLQSIHGSSTTRMTTLLEHKASWIRQQNRENPVAPMPEIDAYASDLSAALNWVRANYR